MSQVVTGTSQRNVSGARAWRQLTLQCYVRAPGAGLLRSQPGQPSSCHKTQSAVVIIFPKIEFSAFRENTNTNTFEFIIEYFFTFRVRHAKYRFICL